eukprot:tig00021534_g22255.t1
MSSAVEKLLCTVFKSDSRCSKIGEAARAKGGAAAEGPGGGGARGDGGAGRAAPGGGLPVPGPGLHRGRPPYAVSAYFDEANRLSCQELCDNRMRRAVDGHLPLLVALAARS